ncbi:hypothetical protein [Undibacterium sp. Ji50W]|uniref:hypothetical protein n=1 Tax=Undibacterium sp. Ji50W TaxID=3413041 RepID=UPI003BF4E9C9
MRNDLEWGSYWGSVNRSIVDAFEIQTGKKFPAEYKNVVTTFDGAYINNADAYRFYSNETKSEVVYGLGLFHAVSGGTYSHKNGGRTRFWPLKKSVGGKRSPELRFD